MKIVGYIVLGLMAAFVLLMIVGTVAGNSPEAEARIRARMAIDLCWQEQSRKSLEPGTARFIAGACEAMEDKFRREHGREP